MALNSSSTRRANASLTPTNPPPNRQKLQFRVAPFAVIDRRFQLLLVNLDPQAWLGRYGEMTVFQHKRLNQQLVHDYLKCGDLK